MAEVLCPRCGAAVPFTGAFAFVLCPNDRTVIYLSQAARAPAGSADPAAIPLPAASTFMPPDLELPPPVHIVRRLARAATIFGTALACFILLCELAGLLLGAPQALAYANATPDPFVPIYFSFPFPILIAGLGGEAAVVWHALLVATIVLSAAFLFRGHGRDAWTKFLRTIQGLGAPTLSEPNAFFAVARIYALSLFSTFVSVAILLAFGSGPQVPASLEREPLGAQLITLANAPVVEEIMTRVLLLGVPLLAVHYLGRGRLEKPWYRYLFGGAFPLEGAAVAFVVFQAVVFAAAHVPGWDLWKFPSTFIGGLGLGVLFLRYGLIASILTHFLIDYLGPASTLTGLTALPDLVLLAIPVVGVVLAIRYVFVLKEILALGRVPEYMGGPPPTSPAPPPVTPLGLAAAPLPSARVNQPSFGDRPPPPPGGPP